jgi:hypothetical protein
MKMQEGMKKKAYLLQRGVAEDDGALCWTTNCLLLLLFLFFCFLYFPLCPRSSLLLFA